MDTNPAISSESLFFYCPLLNICYWYFINTIGISFKKKKTQNQTKSKKQTNKKLKQSKSLQKITKNPQQQQQKKNQIKKQPKTSNPTNQNKPKPKKTPQNKNHVGLESWDRRTLQNCVLHRILESQKGLGLKGP